MMIARRFLGFFVASGLTFGCSSGSPPATHAPAPKTSSSTAAAASAAPSAIASAQTPAANRPPIRAPLPAAPAGVDREQFEILASICGVANYVQDGKPQIGCRHGPPFDKPEHQPDGTIQTKGDLYEVCVLREFYKGSFSAAGKEQAILGIDACGEDRWNDITPGNVLLAERGPEGWQLVRYLRGTNIVKCDIAKRTNGSLLVCGDNVGAWGDGSLRWNFTLDFSKPNKESIYVFSKLYKSAGISCSDEGSMVAERGLTGVEEIKREFKDLNNDGFDDLRLTIERTHVDGTPSVMKRVKAACEKSDNMNIDERAFLGKYKRYTLEFHGNETTLSPTPETQKLLDKWAETAPSFWWNVVRSGT